MNKKQVVLFIVCTVIALSFIAHVSMGEETAGMGTPTGSMDNMKKARMMKGGMTEQGMGRGAAMQRSGMMAMCPLHTKMVESMTSKSIVATSDGGVVIMIGSKLFKYDRDLNLKKEVEVKMDMEGMQKMIEKINEECPTCKMIKEKMSRMEKTSADTTEQK